MATPRSLGDAFTLIKQMQTDLAKAQTDAKAAKQAAFRLQQDLAELIEAGASGGSFIQSGSGAVLRSVQDKERERLAINDFLPTGASNDWRTALVGALAEAANYNAATIKLPRHATNRDIDNTGLGPIIWSSSNGVWLDGAGASQGLRSVSTDGTDLISFSGQSIQRCGFRNLKIDSLSTAGHIWTCTTAGISFSRWENLWVIQRATGKSIMYGRFIDTDPNNPGGGIGMFENQFVGGVYEHGTGSSGTIVPATVPAFDLEATLSLIVLNKWLDLRVNCHGGLAPFFDLHNTDASVGAKRYIHQNVWRGINCELPRRSLIRLRGHASGEIRNVTYYDLGLNGNSAGIDGHLIEVGAGSGGRYSQHTIIEQVQRIGAGNLLGVSGTTRTGKSWSSTSDVVLVADANHPFAVGQRIYIASGALAGRWTLSAVVTGGSGSYTFTVPGVGTTSGTADVAEAALDIKLASGNESDQIIDCSTSGGATIAEVDVVGSSALVSGHIASSDTDGLLVLRPSLTQGAHLELGSDSKSTVSTMRVAEVSTDRITPRGSFVRWGFKGDIDGLQLAYLTATTVQVQPGRCRSEDDADVCNSTANITIDITASGTNGIDTGSVISAQVYDVYLIWKAGSAPTPRGLAVKTGDTPVMPATYVYRRRVGGISIYSNAGTPNVIDFNMLGSGRFREVIFNASELTLRFINAASDVADTNKSVSSFVPIAARNAIVLPRFTGNGAGNKMFLKPSGFTTADWAILTCQVAGQEVRGTPFRMPTSTGRNFHFKVSNALDVASAHCLGYEVFL